MRRGEECTCVSSFSREGHQGVLIQGARLVVGGFENGCSSHCGLGGSDEGEVLASDAQ
jgi:hypothetical protein